MANFPYYIARRYLFSKKSHNAINIISIISVCGVAFTTMALVCTLSVFNGFQDLVASFFTSFDPQLKIIPVEGKVFYKDDPAIRQLRNDKDIALFSECLEDNALAIYRNRQVMVHIKGVGDQFSELTDIDKLLYGDGSFVLHADVLQYGVPGIRLANSLGLGAYFEDPLQIYAPKKGAQINLSNPAASFSQSELYSSGVVFSVNQEKYDNNYILTSIDFARNLFDQPDMVSSIDLKLREGVDVDQAKSRIQLLLGEERFKVLDRYEQQADIFRIMRVEKLIAYIFLTFILLIACFNIIGSVSMLIIDKKDDVRTLRNLGANDNQIIRIFLYEGRMISAMGAVIGLISGLGLCWLQQTYGLIKMGSSEGMFLVDAYPVSVYWGDLLLVFITVLLIGFAALWYPIRYLGRRLIS
ncbi:MAG: FtsX-like permease family protein [Candidatus Paraprevotella stercoravium]|jgi:lipoprotein-releasing system permease protein|uniref:FtsX-like permease family protein n=2 Tax=Bacteroidales TaxID=171549 RepID=A0ABT7U264_9BACE|nr:FtsX-like permease family protein [Candidatus Paraprevotella stercoravium]MDM8144613.1 FtsX-like permease family protein [Bacteroides eggerthii]